MNGDELDWEPEPGVPEDEVHPAVTGIFSIKTLTDEFNRAGFTEIVVEGYSREAPVNILMLLGPNIPRTADHVRASIERCAQAATGWPVQPGFLMLLNRAAVAATFTFNP